MSGQNEFGKPDRQELDPLHHAFESPIPESVGLALHVFTKHHALGTGLDLAHMALELKSCSPSYEELDAQGYERPPVPYGSWVQYGEARDAVDLARWEAMKAQKAEDAERWRAQVEGGGGAPTSDAQWDAESRKLDDAAGGAPTSDAQIDVERMRLDEAASKQAWEDDQPQTDQGGYTGDASGSADQTPDQNYCGDDGAADFTAADGANAGLPDTQDFDSSTMYSFDPAQNLGFDPSSQNQSVDPVQTFGSTPDQSFNAMPACDPSQDQAFGPPQTFDPTQDPSFAPTQTYDPSQYQTFGPTQTFDPAQNQSFAPTPTCDPMQYQTFGPTQTFDPTQNQSSAPTPTSDPSQNQPFIPPSTFFTP